MIAKKEFIKLIGETNKKVDLFLNESFDILKINDYINVFKDYDEIFINSAECEINDLSSKILSLKEKLCSQLENLYDNACESGDYNEAIKIAAWIIQIDVKQLLLFEKLVFLFEEKGIYADLIELYKMMFVYSGNPAYFLKIGDLYYKNENFESAINSYLNYLEVGPALVEVFLKLKELFYKTGDEVSGKTCEEQISALRSQNAK